jgi:hypothetical protein
MKSTHTLIPRFLVMAVFTIIVVACGDSSGSEPAVDQSSDTGTGLVETTEDRDSVTEMRYSTDPTDSGDSFSGALSVAGISFVPGRPTTQVVQYGDLLFAGSGSSLFRYDVDGDRFLGSIGFPELIREIVAAPAGVYVATDNELALFAAESEPVWTRRLPAAPSGRMQATRAAVYLTLADESLRSFAADGSPTMVSQLGIDGEGVSEIYSGRVYVTGSDGTLLVLLASGDELWRRSFGVPISSLSIDQESVLVVLSDGSAAVLDPETGRVRSDEFGDQRVVWGTLAEGQVVLLGNRELFSFDPVDGEREWSVGLERELFRQPVASGGLLLLYGDETLRTVSLSGRQIGELSLPALPAAPSQLLVTELLVPLVDGTIVRIDLDGDGVQIPLLGSDRVWQLPPGGVFRLADREVRLRLRSEAGGVYDISVSSVPEQDLLLTVVQENGQQIATNMGKVELEPSVRAPLEPGVDYQLRIGRAASDEVAEISISTEVVE